MASSERFTATHMLIAAVVGGVLAGMVWPAPRACRYAPADVELAAGNVEEALSILEHADTDVAPTRRATLDTIQQVLDMTATSIDSLARCVDRLRTE